MFVLVAVVAAFCLPELAHADASETKETVEQSVASMLSIGMQFLSALLWPFLVVIGDLMDTDLIVGPGMEERLKGIWIPVRDLVNIAFVLVLLVVAFYNVLGIGGGEGDLAIKTALPKIVLGLVIVNFTFTAGRVALDLANVATTAAFALPELAAGDETPYDFSAVKQDFKIKVCYKTYNETDNTYTSWEDPEEGSGDEEVPIYTKLFCAKGDDGKYDELDGTLEAKYFTDLNANNIGLVMAVNMGGLSNLSLLKEDGLDSFTDLSISLMFSIVMFLVFAISYLVLGIVLVVRLIVLWIALALSPVAVLVYVVPQIKEWAGGGGDFAQKVIKHLVAPIIIGATMSLGYIMISAWDGLAGNSALSSGFKVNEVISTEFLIAGVDDLPQFIIAIASVAIVWTGVFAAASDTYASFATDAIKGFGEKVGEFFYKLPLSVGTVPIGVEGEPKEPRVSPMALKMWADNFLGDVNNGQLAQSQLSELSEKGVTFFGMPLTSGSTRNRNPAANLRRLQELTQGNPTIDYSRANEIALSLADVIQGGTLEGTEKSQLVQRVQTLAQQYARGEGDLTPLRDIMNRPNTSYQQFGFASQAELDAFRANTDPARARWSATNAPNTVQNNRQTITTIVNNISPTGAVATSMTPVQTAMPANASVTTLMNANASTPGSLAAARAAVTAFQANQNPTTLGAARTAVSGALAQAQTLQRDVNAITPPSPLVPNMNTVVTQLQQMEAQLNGINI